MWNDGTVSSCAGLLVSMVPPADQLEGGKICAHGFTSPSARISTSVCLYTMWP